MLLGKLFGVEIAGALRAPFALGDRAELQRLCAAAGWEGIEIKTLDVRARFPSLQQWLHTDIRGWTLAEKLDDDQFDTLVRASPAALNAFVRDDGKVEFEAPALAALARKP